MGKFKLLTKSIIFSTRSKRRFFTFVIVFSMLSGATIVLLSFFDNFSREGLLHHRGVVILADGMDTLTLTQAESDIGGAVPGSEAVIYFKYINFGSNLRIFSINPKYHWAFDEIKPNNLKSGHFPTSTNDVLVSEDALLPLSDSQSAGGNVIYMYTEPVTGSTFRLGITDASSFELTVSGIFMKPSASIVEDDDREWIILTETAFNNLINEYIGEGNIEIYVHSISIIARGDVFGGQAYSNVDALADQYQSLADAPEYSTVDFVGKSAKEGQRTMTLLSLIFGVIGTLLVSTLYSYLITRFRRREVAVLKAMGYSKWDVRIVVLTEILVVAITGFFLGLIAIQLFLWDPIASLTNARESSYVYLIMFSPTALMAFLAVVLSCIPGFILITARILSVRPIEIFRQK